jgi:hypothetical protein
MTSRVAYPTLILTDDCINPFEWEILASDDTAMTVGEYLPDWDYSIPLRVQRFLSLDWSRVTDALDCGEDVKLAAVLKVGTGSGRLPRSILLRVSMDVSHDRADAFFALTIHGDQLSTVLDLTIDIILDAPSARGGVLTPTRPGDRVWKETVRMRLEGEEPRFPIEVADFELLLGRSAAARSPWYLHWSPRDWSRDFHGSMRLYLNRDHKDLIGRVEAEESEVLRSLMADVMGQVCECLVRDVDVDDQLNSWEDGSLGRQARQWLDLAFPRFDLGQARAVLESRPGEFRAAFQAIASIGAEQ